LGLTVVAESLGTLHLRYALESPFTFRCSNWVDDDLPLYYTFKYEVLGTSTTHTPLADEQHATTYEATLPPGNNAYNYTIVGRTEISDSAGGVATAQRNAHVEQYPYAVSSRRRLTDAPDHGNKLRSSSRSLLESSWTLTEYLYNVSNERVATAVDASDPDACAQALSGIAAILNAQNATDRLDLARNALRAHMVGSLLPQCTALMQLTATTATQQAAVTSKIANDGTELGQVAQSNALQLVHALSVAVNAANGGIDDDCVSEITR
jgi:hypothetical protein